MLARAWGGILCNYGAVLHLFSAVTFVLFFGSAATAVQQGDDGLAAATQQFLTAFNNLDMPAFLDCFADDATVFHPPSAPPRTFPMRIKGRAEIQRTFEVVFAQIRTMSNRTAPPFMELTPQDLEVQRFGDGGVVTFHLGVAAARARRTLVYHRAGSTWRIVHLHASIFNQQ
jgi:ketosteroid isomerase-like protein